MSFPGARSYVQKAYWGLRVIMARMDQKPPTANNYSIGCTGNVGGSGYIASKGAPVQPRSLYLAQLAERLGPEAVAAVTTINQRTGPIDEELRARLAK